MNAIREEKSILVRAATPEDAGTLLDIYRPYVTDTCVTFETEVPDREEFAQNASEAGADMVICKDFNLHHLSQSRKRRLPRKARFQDLRPFSRMRV